MLKFNYTVISPTLTGSVGSEIGHHVSKTGQKQRPRERQEPPGKSLLTVGRERRENKIYVQLVA